MKNQTDIRELFTPMQPQAAPLSEKIFITEVLPDVRLQPYIWCYWEIKSRKPLEEDFFCKIASDGCIDIFVNVNNPHESYAMGFYNRSSTYVLGSCFHYAGVRFLPGMFSYLFNTKASELSNAVEFMDAVHKNTSKFLIENIRPGNSIHDIRSVFDKYFMQNLHHVGNEFDPRVYEAILIILKNTKSLSIENDVSKIVGVSPRHLRRLFDFYIGHNIKSFARVVRFQNYLKAHSESINVAPGSLYYDFGYYDQGHFIKEFKTFSGDTPSKMADLYNTLSCSRASFI
ncbi:AraC family transcriptional regulator [Dyadobacter sp. CY107]|uniref:helix-turn-helix domain-containing protein n=1 Tax=Dyadobacter fanqingshengii TaxID=2906443 RepID=UPI001F359C09|nr:AraC family transcriptional regulator [Dyadobacter fanqingshengii]MCF2501985.1 AraC family transcriptional regulator [Dyadobacter fanqingshengii]